MNLRPAWRVFVESSHSSLHFRKDLVIKSSVFLAQSSDPRNTESQCFVPRSLSSPDWSHHHSQCSHFLRSSISNRRFRFGRCVESSAVGLKSNFDYTSDPETLPRSSVIGKFGHSALSASVMSISSEPSLQSLAVDDDPTPHVQNVPFTTDDSKAADEAVKEDVLVQYIVIRKDLVSEQNWPLGSIISQGCHAAVAAIWLHKDDPETALYCRPENLDSMHKVTLEVKGETQLRNLAQKLETAGIGHKLWIEQPENYATCLATKPYHKSQIASHFKKLKLCK